MEIRSDDFVGMLAAIEADLDRPTVAMALGTDEEEVAHIAAGKAPGPEVEDRLRKLYGLSQRGHLGDPASLIASMTQAGSLLFPRMKWALVAFVLIDGLIVAAAVLFFLAR